MDITHYVTVGHIWPILDERVKNGFPETSPSLILVASS